MEDMSTAPIGRQLEVLQTYLRTELKPKSSEEILEATGVDIDGNEDVLHSLTDAESKVVQEKDGRWRWKSMYHVRNREDLFMLLSRSSDGIVEKNLFDSYKGVVEDVAKLKRSLIVYEVRNGSRSVLYPRDRRLELDIAQDVKEKYNSVKVPDAIEVHRYLVENKLKDRNDTAGVPVVQPITRKRPKRTVKRKSKKIKLTNTHMANSGIDLNQDYGGGADSAFK